MTTATVTDLASLKAALTARTEQITIATGFAAPDPIVIDYSVSFIGKAAPTPPPVDPSPEEGGDIPPEPTPEPASLKSVQPIQVDGVWKIETSPNAEPIQVSFENLVLFGNASGSNPVIRVKAENATLNLTDVTITHLIESTPVLHRDGQIGIFCEKDCSVNLQSCYINVYYYGIAIINCKIIERAKNTTIRAWGTHTFYADKTLYPDGFWSNSDVLIEDSTLIGATISPTEDYGTISIEPVYNHCSMGFRRTTFTTEGRSTYSSNRMSHLYMRSYGNLISVEVCDLKLTEADFFKQSAILTVGDPCDDEKTGPDYSKSTVSFNQCTITEPEGQPLVLSLYGYEHYSARVVVVNDGRIIPSAERIYFCNIGKDAQDRPHRWTTVADAINSTVGCEKTVLYLDNMATYNEGMSVSGDRTVYLSNNTGTLTLNGYTLVTGRANVILESNIVVPKADGNRVMVDGLSKISVREGSSNTMSINGALVDLPLTKYDSILSVITTPEFGTMGSSNDGAPFNNAVLKEMIDKIGDRIFCIVLDNSIKIMIGYPSSMVKSVKDIQLVTSNGVDLMLVRQYSPTAEQKRRGVTYVTAHDTALIQYVMYMDPGFESEGIDPLLIH